MNLQCRLGLITAFIALGFLTQPIWATGATLERWSGTWKGTCRLSPAFQGTESFEASVTIGKNEGANGIQWQLIYEASGNLPRQVRNYTMMPVDPSNGHFVVDEHNGLLLDSFVDGNFIYSPFLINGMLITATYILTGQNTMIMDMPSFNEAPIRKTCLTGNSNLCSQSFGLRMSQRCSLTKIE